MLATAALLTASLLTQGTPLGNAPVLVNRKFTKGEYNFYKMNARLTIEFREAGLETFLPDTTGYEYSFGTTVNSVDEDGNASMRYDRTPTYRIGTDDKGDMKRFTDAEAMKLDLVITPINHIIELKEVKAKPAPKLKLMSPLQQISGGQLTQVLAGQYISDLYRLSLFVGSLDSSFDFSPKLPDEPIKVGDTWLNTVSYQPQKKEGNSQMMVQRLDMKYRYDGQKTVNNKKIERVSATLTMDSELTAFVNSQYGMSASESPIKGLRITFKSQLTFDLEPKTFKTLRGEAHSSGNVALQIKSEEGNFAERKITGESNFELAGTKTVKVASSGGSRQPKPR